MVAGLVRRIGRLGLWAADPQAESLLMRLDPPNRAKVLMALLALVLVGAGLIFLVWLGGRNLRRIARRPHAKVRPLDDRWYQKPLNPADGPQPHADEVE